MDKYRDDSYGDYGQWINPEDQSWLDYLGMKSKDVGGAAYNALANITGGLSPIGTSPEGNMALQVPPMVNALMGSGKTIADRGGWGFSGVEEIDAPLKKAWADVLWTGYGGNALAGMTKPRGALGAGAMREASGLPMDHASRMARAKEMGFDTDMPLYKGFYPYESGGPITNYKGEIVGSDGPYVPKTALSGFSSPNPDVANRFSGVFTYPEGHARAGEVGQLFDNNAVAKLYARIKNPKTIDAEGNYAASLQFEEIAKRDGTIDKFNEWKAAKDQGHDAVILKNTRDEGDIYQVFDPKNYRSVNAAFDPSKADSANLLYSDNKPSIFGASLATAGERKNALKNVLGTPDYEAFRAGLEQMPKSQIMEILDGTVSGLTPSVSKAKMLERIDDVQRVKAGFDLKIKAMGNRTAG